MQYASENQWTVGGLRMGFLIGTHAYLYLMMNSPRWILSWRVGGRRKQSEEWLIGVIGSLLILTGYLLKHLFFPLFDISSCQNPGKYINDSYHIDEDWYTYSPSSMTFFFFWVALWKVFFLYTKKRETDWKIILILLEMDSHMHTEWFCTWPSLAVSRFDFFPSTFFSFTCLKEVIYWVHFPFIFHWWPYTTFFTQMRPLINNSFFPMSFQTHVSFFLLWNKKVSSFFSFSYNESVQNIFGHYKNVSKSFQKWHKNI